MISDDIAFAERFVYFLFALATSRSSVRHEARCRMAHLSYAHGAFPRICTRVAGQRAGDLLRQLKKDIHPEAHVRRLDDSRSSAQCSAIASFLLRRKSRGSEHIGLF